MGNEIWKPVTGYEGLYEVSNLGTIKALKRTVNAGKCHRTWEEHFIKFGVDVGRVVMSIMSKVKLFEHQIKALEAVKNQNRVLFGLDMG